MQMGFFYMIFQVLHFIENFMQLTFKSLIGMFNTILMEVHKLVEKPEPENSPSLLGIQGRYVFTPEIFEYQRKTNMGLDGEIQLTDAMQALAQESEMYSWTFDGKRYDIGTMKDWFQSHLELSSDSVFSPILNDVLNKL